MKNGAILLFLFIFLMNCRSPDVVYKNFNGVKYTFCDDFYFAQIHIKEIDKLNINQIIEFAYCLSSEYNFEGISIESDFYYSVSSITGNKKGLTLYKVGFKIIDVSKSDKEVVLEKVVNYAKYRKSGKLIDIPKELYKEQYQCE